MKYKKRFRDIFATRLVFPFCICLLAGLTLTLAVSCGDDAEGSLDIVLENDVERAGLKGPVKSYTLYEVPVREEYGRLDAQLPGTPTQTVQFDRSGNKTESIHYNMLGEPVWRDSYYYDGSGKLTECTSYSCGNDDCTSGSPQWGYKNFYRDNGMIRKITGYSYDEAGERAPGSGWTHLYTYVEADARIVISSYDSSGGLQWRHVDRYDSEARKSHSSHYDSKGGLKWEDMFKYSSEGYMTEWRRYDGNESLQWKDKFKYDDAGNEIECVNYDYDNKTMWTDVYKYTTDDSLAHYYPGAGASADNSFDQHQNWTVKVSLRKTGGFGGYYWAVEEVERRVISYY